MDAAEGLVTLIIVAAGLIAGSLNGGNDRPDCGDAVKDQAVCEQVVARAGEVDHVPVGPRNDEQRDRARGQ